MENLYSVNQKMVRTTRTLQSSKTLKRSFKRNKVIVKGIDDQWDVDLIDMTKFANYNNGYNFILDRYVLQIPVAETIEG